MDNLEVGRQIQLGNKRKLDTQLTFENPEGGEKLTGNFIFKFPSLFEQAQIGVAKSNLLGGAPLHSIDPVTSNIVHMIATLGVVMESKPDWFDLDKLEYDNYEMLDTVYETYIQWRDSFRNSGK